MTSFHDSYAQQKEAYYSVMREAREASPDKQPELIQHLLDMNSELAKEVREYIAQTPTDSAPDLKPELLRIQKEFHKLKETSDRKKTLDMILDQDQHKINTLQWQYNLLLFFLGLSVITIIYMVIRLGGQKMLSSVTPTSSIATT